MIAPGQPGGLKALARPYSRVSGVDGGGVWGRFAAVSIRKRGSEISAPISGPADLMISHSSLMSVNRIGRKVAGADEVFIQR